MGSKLLPRKKIKIINSEQKSAKKRKSYLELKQKRRFICNNKENLLLFLKSNFNKTKFPNTYMSYEKLAIAFDINRSKLF